jgi:hypothetical protein
MLTRAQIERQACGALYRFQLDFVSPEADFLRINQDDVFVQQVDAFRIREDSQYRSDVTGVVRDPLAHDRDMGTHWISLCVRTHFVQSRPGGILIQDKIRANLCEII